MESAKKDDYDIFDDGDENTTEEEKAAAKARQDRMIHARKLKEEKDAKDGKAKKEKVKAVEKSLVVLEVKPWVRTHSTSRISMKFTCTCLSGSGH